MAAAVWRDSINGTALLDTCISWNHLRDVLLTSPAPCSVVHGTTEEVLLQRHGRMEEETETRGQRIRVVVWRPTFYLSSECARAYFWFAGRRESGCINLCEDAVSRRGHRRVAQKLVRVHAVPVAQRVLELRHKPAVAGEVKGWTGTDN